jgi:hypothetical protein
MPGPGRQPHPTGRAAAVVALVTIALIALAVISTLSH